jgi:hypothetical protein
MALPAFNEEGDLPPGVYRATLSEIHERFGQGSLQRRAVADRLIRVYEFVASTVTWHALSSSGHSSTKVEPNDVDIILLMEGTFDLERLSGEAALPFQHM